MKFSTKSNKFSKIGGKSETGGMHHGLREEWTPLPEINKNQTERPKMKTNELPQMLSYLVHRSNQGVTHNVSTSKLNAGLY